MKTLIILTIGFAVIAPQDAFAVEAPAEAFRPSLHQDREMMDRDTALWAELDAIEAELNAVGAEKIDPKREIEVWLERSETYLHLKHYREALDAAEEVFKLDATNVKASGLIDRIRKEAIKDGKTGIALLEESDRDEVELRIATYQEKALQQIHLGYFGKAKLLINKLLLLNSGHPETLRLQQLLKEHTANEQRKTL